MSVIGVDFGNGFTKTSKKNVMFKSSYMNGFDSDMNKEAIKVELDGKKYTVGVERDRGNVDVNVNTRYESKLHELSILTAIALSFEENVIETAVVVGVPADNYDSLKGLVKKKVLGYSNKSIKIVRDNKEETKLITITNVLVMPQGAIVLLDPEKYRNSNNFVLDIGGGTAIASIWRGLKFFKARTISTGGMLRLYTAIAQNLNKELNTDYNSETIQTVLKLKEIKDGKGNKFNIDEDTTLKKIIDDTVETHILKIITDVEEVLGVEPIQANIQTIMGGGALSNLTTPKFKQYYKDLEVADYPQFVNSLIFETIGIVKKIDLVEGD